MKRIFQSFGILAAAVLISTSLAGQCIPDTECIDVNESGEICPANLPSGIVGTPYAQAITIIPPSTGGEIIVFENYI